MEGVLAPGHGLIMSSQVTLVDSDVQFKKKRAFPTSMNAKREVIVVYWTLTLKSTIKKLDEKMQFVYVKPFKS